MIVLYDVFSFFAIMYEVSDLFIHFFCIEMKFICHEIYPFVFLSPGSCFTQKVSENNEKSERKHINEDSKIEYPQ